MIPPSLKNIIPREIRDMTFDVNEDSKRLKELISQYDSDHFLIEIIELLKFDGFGRIPYRPFISLDSPLRQLSFLANLNLTSDSENIVYHRPPTLEEWNEIIKYCVKVKAGYYDALLPTDDDDDDEYKHLYQTAMPVYFDYHDTGTINYEEQEIERIEILFTPFNEIISQELGFEVKDLISIYDSIGGSLNATFNEPLDLLRKDAELRDYKNEMLASETFPSQWNYKNYNENIKRFIELMTGGFERNRVNSVDIENIETGKLKSFFDTFSSQRSKSDFLFYTSKNDLLRKPLYFLDNESFVVLSHKQLIHAIYKKLYEVVASSPKSENFFRHRGAMLQEKVTSLFKRYLGSNAHYYNEYKVDRNGQDVLVLNRSRAFIIETKSGKEVELSPNPDIKHVYKQYLKTFKKNIDSAYLQCYRVKEKFIEKSQLQIDDKKDKEIIKIRTKNYRNTFSMIITQDRFRQPQINLSGLLEVYEDDDYPLSMCIDDFEILILTLVKLKISPGQFERMLLRRLVLQGRVNTDDELEIWAELISNPDLRVPEDENVHFSPGTKNVQIFDKLYSEGLGFENERNLDKKKSTNWKNFMGYNAPF